jgi:hypothetical protein
MKHTSSLKKNDKIAFFDGRPKGGGVTPMRHADMAEPSVPPHASHGGDSRFRCFFGCFFRSQISAPGPVAGRATYRSTGMTWPIINCLVVVVLTRSVERKLSKLCVDSVGELEIAWAAGRRLVN